MNNLKIGIDIDGTIDATPQSIQFFRLLTKHLFDHAEIFIITNREPGTESSVAQELQELGIQYHHLKITGNKASYIIEHGIDILFEDTDEYFLELDEKVTVFKIREDGNFSFDEHRWIGSDRTTKMI